MESNEIGRFAGGTLKRLVDDSERSRLELAIKLERAAVDEIVSPIEEIHAAIEVADAIADARAASPGLGAPELRPEVAEELAAEGIVAAAREGSEADLDAAAAGVVEVRRQAERLEIRDRVANQAVKFAQTAVVHAVSRSEGALLEVIGDGLRRVVAEGAKHAATFPIGATARDLLGGNRKAATAFLELDRLGAEYERLRGLFTSWTAAAPDRYGELLGSRRGRLFSECRNPLAVAVAAAPDDPAARRVLAVPASPWPGESSDPEECRKQIRHRFEVLARHGGEVWAPSPAELRRAVKGSMPRQPAATRDDEDDGDEDGEEEAGFGVLEVRQG